MVVGKFTPTFIRWFFFFSNGDRFKSKLFQKRCIFCKRYSFHWLFVIQLMLYIFIYLFINGQSRTKCTQFVILIHTHTDTHRIMNEPIWFYVLIIDSLCTLIIIIIIPKTDNLNIVKWKHSREMKPIEIKSFIIVELIRYSQSVNIVILSFVL